MAPHRHDSLCQIFYNRFAGAVFYLPLKFGPGERFMPFCFFKINALLKKDVYYSEKSDLSAFGQVEK